jgi:hypothetical protein
LPDFFQLCIDDIQEVGVALQEAYQILLCVVFGRWLVGFAAFEEFEESIRVFGQDIFVVFSFFDEFESLLFEIRNDLSGLVGL